MNPLSLVLIPALLMGLGAVAAEIPSRPEKLTFPPLQYEPPSAAEYRVALKSGPVAYVVSDRELPLINIAITVRVGDYLDPAGKEGVSGLTGYLLTRGGTKAKTAEALEERLAFLAANLGSGVGNVSGSVSLNLLTKDLDEGLAILREVLTEPRFQDDKLALRKQQLLQGMKERNDDSSSIEGYQRNYLAYGEAFFLNRQLTEASVNAITRADLEAFHKDWFHPANFLVAVSGDFDRADMIARLEKLFANWPFRGKVAPKAPSDAKMVAPGIYLTQKDVNQGRVSILLPGLMRSDADWVPAQVMNHILGGGGFTSRIMNRVRSDEGLAYSAGSGLAPGIWYPGLFRAAFQTKSHTVAYATSIVMQEMERIAAEPVSDQELTTAKRSFIDTFPRQFASKAQIAGTFADEELTGRAQTDPAWFKNFRARVEAVTKEDVQRVAKRLLKPKEARVLAVGQKEEMLKGHPDHPVGLKDLSNGQIKDLPLRDPLTMKSLVK